MGDSPSLPPLGCVLDRLEATWARPASALAPSPRERWLSLQTHANMQVVVCAVLPGGVMKSVALTEGDDGVDLAERRDELVGEHEPGQSVCVRRSGREEASSQRSVPCGEGGEGDPSTAHRITYQRPPYQSVRVIHTQPYDADSSPGNPNPNP